MQWFSLESLSFSESCSVAGATQCQGNTGICFHQRDAFPAKLAAAVGEALTGKHFHSPCARRGAFHQWLRDRIVTFTFWSLSLSFLPSLPPPPPRPTWWSSQALQTSLLYSLVTRMMLDGSEHMYPWGFAHCKGRIHKVRRTSIV